MGVKWLYFQILTGHQWTSISEKFQHFNQDSPGHFQELFKKKLFTSIVPLEEEPHFQTFQSRWRFTGHFWLIWSLHHWMGYNELWMSEGTTKEWCWTQKSTPSWTHVQTCATRNCDIFTNVLFTILLWSVLLQAGTCAVWTTDTQARLQSVPKHQYSFQGALTHCVMHPAVAAESAAQE